MAVAGLVLGIVAVALAIGQGKKIREQRARIAELEDVFRHHAKHLDHHDKEFTINQRGHDGLDSRQSKTEEAHRNLSGVVDAHIKTAESRWKSVQKAIAALLAMREADIEASKPAAPAKGPAKSGGQ